MSTTKIDHVNPRHNANSRIGQYITRVYISILLSSKEQVLNIHFLEVLDIHFKHIHTFRKMNIALVLLDHS